MLSISVYFCLLLSDAVPKASFMATRRALTENKAALKENLREACRAGRMKAGEPAPPLRQLAEEFSLSKDIAAQAMRELIGEGLFYAVPRKGTFVGRPLGSSFEHYLLIGEVPVVGDTRGAQLRWGFEDRVAQLGGAPLMMTPAQFDSAFENGDLPPIAGVYEQSWIGEEKWQAAPFNKAMPRVRFGVKARTTQPFDFVSFDDEGGARLATQHLVSLGHKRIGFLGFKSESANEELDWVRVREKGWRESLHDAGLPHHDLSFEAGSESAAGFAMRDDLPHRLVRARVSAVVAANDRVALALLRTLRESPLPEYQWPSIIGFDDEPELAAHLVTSLRLPWDELGRAAADLLWERSRGQLEGAATHRRVPMRLIPRLTCRKDWSSAGHAALAVPV
jgi:hypothetical protein